VAISGIRRCLGCTIVGANFLLLFLLNLVNDSSRHRFLLRR